MIFFPPPSLGDSRSHMPCLPTLVRGETLSVSNMYSVCLGLDGASLIMDPTCDLERNKWWRLWGRSTESGGDGRSEDEREIAKDGRKRKCSASWEPASFQWLQHRCLHWAAELQCELPAAKESATVLVKPLDSTPEELFAYPLDDENTWLRFRLVSVAQICTCSEEQRRF